MSDAPGRQLSFPQCWVMLALLLFGLVADSPTMTVFAGEHLACVRGERMVFHGLGFRLEPGAALLLSGPNGSGKSSLLRLMAGLLAPVAGRMTWGGTDIADDRVSHGGRLHYVGHLDAVKPVLTVTENLGFWASLHGGGDAAGRVAEALARFDLRHLEDFPARYLSAGQRRRLGLARIAAAPAPLWLLDEPTVALDRASVERLTETIEEHRAGGGQVVIATHDKLDLPNRSAIEMDRFEASDAQMLGDVL